MKKWKPFLRMEHTAGADRKANVRDYAAYIFRQGECTLGFSSEGVLSDEARAQFVNAQKEIWERILSKEKRHDSRLDSRLMVPIPNHADAGKIAEAVAQIFKDENVYFALAIHQGKRGKKGVENRHVHVQFSQRDAAAGPKNRNLISKDFLQKINQVFQAELTRQGFQITSGKGKRARVPRVAYQMHMRGEQITNPSAKLDFRGAAILLTNSPEGAEKEEQMDTNKEWTLREEMRAGLRSRDFVDAQSLVEIASKRGILVESIDNAGVTFSREGMRSSFDFKKEYHLDLEGIISKTQKLWKEETQMEKDKEKEKLEKLSEAERRYAEGYARRVAVLSERGWQADEIMEKLGRPVVGDERENINIQERWNVLHLNRALLEKALPLDQLREMERESREAKRETQRGEEQARREAQHAGKNFLDQLSPEALLSFGQGDPRALIKAIMAAAPAIPALVQATQKAAKATAQKAKMSFEQAKEFASKLFQPRPETQQPEKDKDQEIEAPGNSPSPGR